MFSTAELVYSPNALTSEHGLCFLSQQARLIVGSYSDLKAGLSKKGMNHF